MLVLLRLILIAVNFWLIFVIVYVQFLDFYLVGWLFLALLDLKDLDQELDEDATVWLYKALQSGSKFDSVRTRHLQHISENLIQKVHFADILGLSCVPCGDLVSDIWSKIVLNCEAVVDSLVNLKLTHKSCVI